MNESLNKLDKELTKHGGAITRWTSLDAGDLNAAHWAIKLAQLMLAGKVDEARAMARNVKL